ncbi:potassium channel family protein [Methanococcoides sp. SA1]|nr:potassium channel family protein [Methanococcoides sp. SA1]
MTFKNDELARKIENKLEVPIIIVAFFVLPLVLIELEVIQTNPQIVQIARLLDDTIWFIFLAEFMLLLGLHSNRRAYTKNNWFMLLLLVLTPPVIVPEGYSSLRSLRSLRIFRALRSFRIIIAIRRGLRPVFQLFEKNSMHYVTFYSIGLIIFSGILFSKVEYMGIDDGIWWALTTVTTVGYGDLYPETPIGRFLAFFVMMIGIGFVSILTANITAYFVENDTEDENEMILELVHKIDELSNKIDKLENKLSEK